MRRLVAIGFVWVGCAIAWMTLGSSLVVRSDRSGETLGAEVHGLWGAPLSQAPPRAFYIDTVVDKQTRTVEREGIGPVETTIAKKVEVERDILLNQSAIDAGFTLEHRRRGLVWFPTYTVAFDGSYTFENDSGAKRTLTIRFPIDSHGRTYDDFVVQNAAGVPIETKVAAGAMQWSQSLNAGQSTTFAVSFRTRGVDNWRYEASAGAGEARNFVLRAKTDFSDIDFPANTLSPTEHKATHDGWAGRWQFSRLITQSSIGLQMPQKLNPGPLASKITFFAPVSLLFFFFVVSMLAIRENKNLHPMHYFLLGCAFFAFHLLFAYLVDHVSIAIAFSAASAVSIALVVSYARLFVGWTFALREIAISQLLYLVLFSYTFFWKGFTGLTITVVAIATLFVVMQLTGRMNWNEVFGRPPTVVRQT